MQKFPVKTARGEIRFIRTDSIRYIESVGGDIRIRRRGKALLPSVERLEEAEKRLAPLGNFFRCHRSYLVNLDRVKAIRPKGSAYEMQLDPPVNVWIPLSRDRYGALKRKLRL